ncbi:Zinc finger CCCH domain-containing protein 64 [Symbiodinium microadriaticum]|uniref:Zinc finger CCCH domain-containing protein 64 n=1 Tax=Symbiodinium microadriaticum TaxID=2951 RepID=A0A1Q9DF23_SYMMI|nr:Zinc finger CCCH domain-containing protein 64 [Symbiodinium microadriaticum]
MTYEGKSKLKLMASGSESGSELLSCIRDDQVVFGGLRAKSGKFWCLMCTGADVGGLAKGRAAAHKNAAFNALEGTIAELCALSKEEFGEQLELQNSFHKDKKAPSMDDRRRVLLVGDAEGNLTKLYAQDEATLLTVMTRGLATDVDVPAGKDLGYAKNRAIDKLWQNIPFCHAVAALANLRIFDAESGEELQEGEAVWDGMKLLLAMETPGEGGPSAAASAFASVVSAVGRHKLGLDGDGKELKARLKEAGLSTDGCLEKSDLIVETQQKKVGQFTALFAVGAFLPTVGDKEAAAGLAEFVSGGRKVPIDTYFIDSQSAAFLQAAPEGKQLCENLNFLGGFGIREIHGLTVAYLSGCQNKASKRQLTPGIKHSALVGFE